MYATLLNLQSIGVPVSGTLNQDRNWEAVERATSMLRGHFRREFLPHRAVVTFDASRREQLRMSSDVKLEVGGYDIAPVMHQRETIWQDRSTYSGDHKWLPLDLPHDEVSHYGILQRSPDYGLLEVDAIMGAFVERGAAVAISAVNDDAIDVPIRAFNAGDSLVLLTETPSTPEHVEICEIENTEDVDDSTTRLTLHRGLVGTSRLETPFRYVATAPHPTIAGAAQQLANQLSAQGGNPSPSQDDYISEVDYPQIWRMIRTMRTGRQLARLGVPSRRLPAGAY
ncbi:MAG: hypothetical protein F4Z28_13405 [Gammaproteobacteria bacterium]|nr:hypothetical protein [Gammaproteobacteria bacterium]